jgi:hypothetical protein
MLPTVLVRRAIVVLIGIIPLELVQRWLGQCAPAIVFLPANDVPGRIAVVIGRTAILEIVKVIAQKMGMYARLPQQLRHRIVERFQWTPGTMHEVHPPRVQVTPSRHARQGPDEVVVEG